MSAFENVGTSLLQTWSGLSVSGSQMSEASPWSWAEGPQAGGGIFFPFIFRISKWIQAIRDRKVLGKSNRDLDLGEPLESSDPASR